MSVIVFIAGLLIGAIVGTFTMALAVAARDADDKTEREKENSDEIKREMCKRAVLSGVCPHTCDTCAWNTLE